MIARVWRGETRAEDAERYLEYLRAVCVPDARATPGNRGVRVLRRVGEGRAEFVFTSLWESMESIRAFAGGDVERARYYPEDPRFLLALDPRVRHFEVAVDERETERLHG